MKEAYWPLGLSAGICIHDEVLDARMCADIIQFFEDNPELSFEGRTFGGIMPDIKLSVDSYIDRTLGSASDEQRQVLGAWEDTILEQYGTVLREYTSFYDALDQSWTNRIDSGYQYQRYLKGTGFYATHIDGAPYLENDGSKRVLASVMYLNTVDVGGGTRFELHDYTCDALVGRVVTFPATFLHRHGGLVPESSDKSIISTFVCVPQPTHDH